MQAVQEADIASRIILLRFAQNRPAPIARLLLFGDIGAEQFLHQLLQAMAIGEGPGKARSDLGAEKRGRCHLQIMLDCGKVEASKMEKFQAVGVTQYTSQIGSGIIATRAEADEMFIAASVGNLQQAQPVAQCVEAHGFGIDRQRRGAFQHAIGQVFFVEENAHPRSNFLCRIEWLSLCPSNADKARFTTFTLI